jgi:hypothetical protein
MTTANATPFLSDSTSPTTANLNPSIITSTSWSGSGDYFAYLAVIATPFVRGSRRGVGGIQLVAVSACIRFYKKRLDYGFCVSHYACRYFGCCNAIFCFWSESLVELGEDEQLSTQEMMRQKLHILQSFKHRHLLQSSAYSGKLLKLGLGFYKRSYSICTVRCTKRLADDE